MQRVSEERTPLDAQLRPDAAKKISAKESVDHVHNLLGDGQVAEKHDRPKGLGSAQLLPQHRPGTANPGRKRKSGLPVHKASTVRARSTGYNVYFTSSAIILACPCMCLPRILGVAHILLVPLAVLGGKSSGG